MTEAETGSINLAGATELPSEALASNGEGGAEWVSSLSPELRSLVQAKGYKTPADVVQAYAHAQRAIGADKIPMPKDGEWDDIARSKLGIPKVADGYKITRPELPAGLPYDEALEKAALPIAHKLGLTPHQVQGLIEFYAGHQTQSVQSMLRGRQEEETLAINQLQQEWGGSYDTSDTIVLAYPTVGETFLYGVLTADTSLGSSQVSIGITGTTAKYKALGTFTATDTPTFFGKAAAQAAKLSADETVFMTIGSASLPSSGTLIVDLYFAQS